LTGLKVLKEEFSIVGDVDGLGLAMRMEICGKDGFSPDKAMTDRIFEEGMKGDLEWQGRRYGLVLDIGGYYKNVITLAPALTISHAEIDMAIGLLGQLLRRCTRKS
jgi:4-aminobutyrate aminotransferase-like enzyme